ncbi:NmrA family NAD(P)-binding protein [Cupriavidus basilensis]|uniref:NmrA family NAD(P)-binding protein n=1 Tax=Cupriavidus basilensis TaxID=68895 RepID=A0ABT6ATB9_9BURK|nr:NmrA family NAD(P)-binding protein [Cupriavidus basilensis]MDF3835875.1 NmrA family NAD(P)-binding protein [Cupriavidus basilensis]
MNTTYPYAVFGVSGRTGAAAADALLRAKQPVRVVVRDLENGRPWSARGAEVVVADLTDLDSVTAALRQVRGAYVISPQHYSRENLFELAELIADVIANAAVAASVPKLVALSSIGADRESGTGWIQMNRLFEQRLGGTGIPVTFLRAAYFMENWTPMVERALRNGALPSFLVPPQRLVSMVATADVGQAGADLLLEEWTGTRAVTLAGPEEYSPNDVAAAMEAVLKRPIGVAALPEADWPAALVDAHFSTAALAGFTTMSQGINSRHIAAGTDPDAEQRRGTTPLAHVIAELVKQQR